jgi:hypothetical protein
VTTSYTCKNCGHSHTDPAAMIQRRGKPISLCWDCRKESLRAAAARKSGGGSAVKKTLADVVEKTVAKAPAPVTLNGHLEVASGFGFRVSRENGQFIVEQDTSEGETATMVFNADEIHRLTEWVNSTPREI